MRRTMKAAAVSALIALAGGAAAQPFPSPGGGTQPGPPPAGNVDFKAVLLGTWYFEGMTGPGGYQVWTTIRVEYMADSTYRGASSQQMAGLPPNQAALGGRWSIQPVSADSFMLTHMPFQGYGGGASEYRFVDRDTLLNVQTNETSRRIR